MIYHLYEVPVAVAESDFDRVADALALVPGDGTGTGLTYRETNLIELIISDPRPPGDSHTDQANRAYVSRFRGEFKPDDRHSQLAVAAVTDG